MLKFNKLGNMGLVAHPIRTRRMATAKLVL